MSGNSKTTTPTEPTAQGVLSRDALRAKIFGAKPESRTIEFFGGQVELRQPTLGAAMEMRRLGEEDATVQMLVNYAFVPGTQEHVFEEADAEGIQQIPFGPDMQRLTTAINDLIGVTVEGLEKQVGGAMKSPAEGPSEDSGDVDSGGAT
jgi:hypothetical protein